MHPPLHLGVVAIEKGPFGSASTKVAKFTVVKIKQSYFVKFCSWVHSIRNDYFEPLHVVFFVSSKIFRSSFIFKFFTIMSIYCAGVHFRYRHKKSELLIGWLFGFYGISTFVGYLMPNPVDTYIRHMICKRIPSR